MYRIKDLDEEKKYIYFEVDPIGSKELENKTQVEYKGKLYKIVKPVVMVGSHFAGTATIQGALVSYEESMMQTEKAVEKAIHSGL